MIKKVANYLVNILLKFQKHKTINNNTVVYDFSIEFENGEPISYNGIITN